MATESTGFCELTSNRSTRRVQVNFSKICFVNSFDVVAELVLSAKTALTGRVRTGKFMLRAVDLFVSSPVTLLGEG